MCHRWRLEELFLARNNLTGFHRTFADAAHAEYDPYALANEKKTSELLLSVYVQRA